MKKLTFPLFLIIIASAGFKPVNNTVTKSAITFQARNMGIGIDGTIGGLKADVQFNAGNLAVCAIDASVDVSTVNTDNSMRDDHLKSDEFFDAPHYPKISLKSVSFKHKSGNNYIGVFKLTMKNKTKQVEIPFTFTQKSNAMAFKGSFKLNRLDFGVGDSSMILSDDVTVNIDAEFGS
jgi:polyisoprenoid-binding protein YceI